MTGVALLVLPGPGIVVILIGLAILGTEFAWARRSMHKAKHHGSRVTVEGPKSAALSGPSAVMRDMIVSAHGLSRL